jgi:hypothetical protein
VTKKTYHIGCGEVFETEDDVYPYDCPKCHAVFCGDECCGSVAVSVEE